MSRSWVKGQGHPFFFSFFSNLFKMTINTFESKLIIRPWKYLRSRSPGHSIYFQFSQICSEFQWTTLESKLIIWPWKCQRSRSQCIFLSKLFTFHHNDGRLRDKSWPWKRSTVKVIIINFYLLIISLTIFLTVSLTFSSTKYIWP